MVFTPKRAHKKQNKKNHMIGFNTKLENTHDSVMTYMPKKTHRKLR